jgi:hypothetical protein
MIGEQEDLIRALGFLLDHPLDAGLSVELAQDRIGIMRIRPRMVGNIVVSKYRCDRRNAAQDIRMVK